MSDRDEERSARNEALSEDDKQQERRGVPRNGEKRLPYADRWERQGKRENREPRSYQDRGGERPARDESKPRFERDGERRPYQDRGSERRPFGERPARGESKPRFERDGERRPYQDRGSERRPFGERPARGESKPRFERDGERRPYQDRGSERRPFGERPARDESKPRFERDGERKPWQKREGKADRFEHGEQRPPRYDGPHGRDLDAIHDLDEELLRLIMRRARLLQKISSKGRISPETEKALRLVWEQKAAHLTRDSRLSRDMFALLQAVEPLSRVEEEQSFFNLAPSRAPVNLDLPAPGDLWEARCWMTLAAASGQALALHGVSLSDGVIDCLKSLNQIGGQLRWEEDGSINGTPGKGLVSGLDKVVHVGDDAVSFWLILALCLGFNSRLKITGSQELRFLNLTPLRHFLPALGARLTNVIPAQDGLPIRLECCGMLPDEIVLPEDVHPDFVAALALAAPFRDKDTRLRLPQAFVADTPSLRAALHVLSQCGIQARQEGSLLELPRQGLSVPSHSSLSPDLPLSAVLLALPALCGGKAKLGGSWPNQGAQARLAKTLLESIGLSLQLEAGHMETSPHETAPAVASSSPLNLHLIREIREQAPALWPLAVLLASAAAKKNVKIALPTPDSLSRNEAQTLEAFLAQLALEQDAGGLLQSRAMQDSSSPWLAPDAGWAMALAWAALLRPNLRLVNPGVISAVWPKFWNVYNSLPNPELDRKKEAEVQDDKPTHRRIIAPGVYATLPEVPEREDD